VRRVRSDQHRVAPVSSLPFHVMGEIDEPQKMQPSTAAR
jgi:hypothetical protein